MQMKRGAYTNQHDFVLSKIGHQFMHAIQNKAIQVPRRTRQFEQNPAPLSDETKSQRVERIYRTPGGPVIGWLLDEARRRNSTLNDMAAELGVTYGYINQLRTGFRSTENLSQALCSSIARYLGTCTVVIKLLANQIKMSDFSFRAESEEAMVDRAMRALQDDPKIRHVLPCDLHLLPFEAKKALVLMYSEVSSDDSFGTRQLPNILFWLQRAAVAHDENEYAAIAGHRDTSVRL